MKESKVKYSYAVCDDLKSHSLSFPSFITLAYNIKQRHNIRQNDTQHNDIEPNTEKLNPQGNNTHRKNKIVILRINVTPV